MPRAATRMVPAFMRVRLPVASTLRASGYFAFLINWYAGEVEDANQQCKPTLARFMKRCVGFGIDCRADRRKSASPCRASQDQATGTSV
jgi:hypothetical protein